MRSYLILFLWLFCLPIATRGQTIEDDELEKALQPVLPQSILYWFDEDATNIQTIGGLSGTYSLDVSSLANGLHILHCQVIGQNDNMYGIGSQLFVKMNGKDEYPINSIHAGSTLKYWFDEDINNTRTISGMSGTYLLDVSSLPDGLHLLHCVLVGTEGTTYDTTSGMFVKMERFLPEEIMGTSVAAKGFTYWFDDDSENKQTAYDISGKYILDVSSLADGLHNLHYYILGDNGMPYGLTTKLFVKNEEKLINNGPNGITMYKYWINGDKSTAQTVTLDKPANPYSLISLLPVQKMPIRTSSFHFQVTDGTPAIFAKNDLQIRFYDARGEFVDNFMEGGKSFIDYSVSQEVTDITLLESGVHALTEKPEVNAIKWYKVTAVKGDSLSFKLDRAATIQLFAPSGKEVYNASGVDAVEWDGCHAEEDGTFYVALHDVTATYGNDISIDYEHIDKYAVLRQDVNVVGNGGCSTITFEGNGFRDLYAVDLFNEQGDSIHHVIIGHESDATTSVLFDFTDAVLGTYHAKFRFAGEDKVFYNIVTVEEAREIELATTVTYPSTFLRGTPTTYTIRITNNGNMTAYNVPIYISVNGSPDIEVIKLKGFDTKKLSELLSENPSWLDGDNHDWVRSEIENLKEWLGKMAESHYFQESDVQDDNSEFIIALLASLFTDIPPLTSKTYEIEINTTNIVEVSIDVTNNWEPYASKNNIPRNNFLKDLFCCHHEKIECLATSISELSDVISLFPLPASTITGVIGCLSGAISQISESSANTFCSDYLPTVQSQSPLVKKVKGFSPWGTILSCATSYFKKFEEFKQFLTMVSSLSNLPNFMHTMAGKTGACRNAWSRGNNCPGGQSRGGVSSPIISYDPNAMYGYTTESGNHAVKDGLTDVYYRIEFENDTAFATAPAHDIYLADTLDATKFDLSTFKPTRVKIGKKSAELKGDKNYVTTIDMRPEINAIAQVEGTFDEKNGIVKWHISSLDPMTMEPTDDVMQGVLPVNVNGNGMGEVMFDISLKPGLAHGTEIKNCAAIVFDQNETIMTPYWTNVIDRISPESHVADVQMATDSTAEVRITSTDELSGPWRYNVYVQYGSGAWFLGAENVPIDSVARVKVYEGIDHGFYTLVTDSAGNVEQKEAAREFSFEVFAPQVDTNTKIELAQGWNWISHNQQEVLAAETLKPKALRIVSQTDELFKDSRFGWTGDLDELLPTELYKVQMAEAGEVQLSGKLFNAAFRSVPLYEGWNWMGYPVAKTMSPAEALLKLEAEEGDFIVGQDGMATFTDGQWTGTLTEMQPGQGYMYRSVSDKNLFLNATAQSSSRRATVSGSMSQVSCPDGWTVDKRKYPNVMGLVADLVQDGETADADKWIVAAFCGEECRGLSQTVGGHLMMNVYGQGSERITFMAMSRESGEVVAIEESEPFRTDVLGSMRQPYELHSGMPMGISLTPAASPKGEGSIYMLDGRRVDHSSRMENGVYIVTDGNKTRKQVNHNTKK